MRPVRLADMRSQEKIVLFAAALLSAITTTLLLSLVTLTEIEEAWNIVVVSQAVGLVRTIFILCLAHAVVLGLPFVLLLRAIGRLGIIYCALAGFLVGAVPSGLLALISMFAVQSASTGGTPTVVGGVPTLAGWIEYVYTVGFIGLFGLAGGLTFGVVMQLSGLNLARSNQPPPANLRLRSGSIVSLAVLLTGVILALPVAIKDNTCHNLFRDGRTSIGPQITGDIKLPTEDWVALKDMFVEFASTHGLSFRSDEQVRRGTVMWRGLSVCSEAGVTIQAMDQLWLAGTDSALAGRGINLSIFELRPGSGWNAFARDLLAKIDQSWPHGMTFHGPDGKIISEEEALQGRK